MAVVETVAQFFEVVDEYDGVRVLFYNLIEQKIAQTKDARVLDNYCIRLFDAQPSDDLRENGPVFCDYEISRFDRRKAYVSEAVAPEHGLEIDSRFYRCVAGCFV